MNPAHFFLLFLLMAGRGYAQKQILEVFDAKGIREIQVFAEEIFKVNIKAGTGEKIILKSRSEGEYYNDIALDTELLNGKLIIRSRFPQILQGGYDKLSAHKVFSLEIKLEIPEDLLVLIESGIASVTGSGKFRNLRMELISGSVNLQNFTGNAVVNTYRGSVNIETSGAEVKAFSRHGKVSVSDFPPSEYRIQVTSIKGDIEVVKTK